jgi:crotonobetainyl-CoA:carnitine CoA-transferase CaiB-like acyl-CoA transferase
MTGVRVLEVAGFTFVPSAGAVLADWGAGAVNPKIIYARGTGHGASGAERERGGCDATDDWARSVSGMGGRGPLVGIDRTRGGGSLMLTMFQGHR